MEVVFHGHSFIEISTDEKTIFIDPFIRGNKKCDLTIEDAINKKPDYVIVTHGHQDHFGDSFELLEATNAIFVANFELCEYVKERISDERISSQGPGGEVDYGKGVAIKLFQATHGGKIRSSLPGVYSQPTGVIVRVDGTSIFHAGDTCLTKDFELLGEYEKITIACLPIGDRYTMGIDDAVIATTMIKSKYVIPIHFDTRPQIKADGVEFARKVMMEQKSVPKVLRPGQSIVI